LKDLIIHKIHLVVQRPLLLQQLGFLLLQEDLASMMKQI
jgi:hypothetical protein